MPIELKNVRGCYPSFTEKRVPALHDISLRVEDGEFIGIMGHTGCGKTTLLMLLAGLLEPTEGQVLLDGEDISAPGYDRGKLRRQVGVVFQYPETQLFETTVERDVAFGLKHSGLPRSEVAERVRQALEQVGFDVAQIGGLSPLSLSGGEKRRVAIAGVLALRPRILLFDEPVAGLDPRGRASFLSLIKRLNREGVTVFMVSHNADALSECAGRLLVLEEGRLVLDKAADAAFSDYARMRALGVGPGFAGEIAGRLAERGVALAPVANYEALRAALIQKLSKGGAPS